jgi:hypothetical protein
MKVPAGSSCRVCAHPKLDEIESELVRPGTNRRAVARRFGLGRMSVLRHQQLHLPERVQRAAEAAKSAPASQKTLQQVAELNKLARAIFTRGYNDNNLGAAVAALRELRKIIEFEGRLLGTVPEPGARINIDFTVDREALVRMAGAFLAVQAREALPGGGSTIDAEILGLSAHDDEAGR